VVVNQSFTTLHSKNVVSLDPFFKELGSQAHPTASLPCRPRNPERTSLHHLASLQSSVGIKPRNLNPSAAPRASRCPAKCRQTIYDLAASFFASWRRSVFLRRAARFLTLFFPLQCAISGQHTRNCRQCQVQSVGVPRARNHGAVAIPARCPASNFAIASE
jgi:hypothetical protein